MTATLAPVTALLLSVAMPLMGNGLQGTLLPVRAQFEDFSALDIGVLGSAYFLGFAPRQKVRDALARRRAARAAVEAVD